MHQDANFSGNAIVSYFKHLVYLFVDLHDTLCVFCCYVTAAS